VLLCGVKFVQWLEYGAAVYIVTDYGLDETRGRSLSPSRVKNFLHVFYQF
jgi:hypothetical protein